MQLRNFFNKYLLNIENNIKYNWKKTLFFLITMNTSQKRERTRNINYKESVTFEPTKGNEEGSTIHMRQLKVHTNYNRFSNALRKHSLKLSGLESHIKKEYKVNSIKNYKNICFVKNG